MRAAFESVKQQEARSIRLGGIEANELEEITVRSVPPLDARWQARLAAAQASAECGAMRIGEPPSGEIGAGVRQGN